MGNAEEQLCVRPLPSPSPPESDYLHIFIGHICNNSVKCPGAEVPIPLRNQDETEKLEAAHL